MREASVQLTYQRLVQEEICESKSIGKYFEGSAAHIKAAATLVKIQTVVLAILGVDARNPAGLLDDAGAVVGFAFKEAIGVSGPLESADIVKRYMHGALLPIGESEL
ncbi:MAG TPA: hypothetical protein DDW52_23020 [Planctomycetaceae bacterium]|nr:hypothetical protein [Planctomycetaceae bacterium]